MIIYHCILLYIICIIIKITWQITNVCHYNNIYIIHTCSPFNLKDSDTDPNSYNLEYNPYSWNEVAHVLYVEQPLRYK
jgi:hypothetical protein